MKFLLATLLPLVAIADQVVHECQMTYGVNMITSHKDDIVATCNEEEFNAIGNVIHDVVELDMISAMLGTEIDDFVAAYEQLGENSLMALLDLNVTLTEEELALHTEVTDTLDELYYNSCGADEEEECPGIDRRLASGRDFDEVLKEAKELMRMEREADAIADAKLEEHQRRRLKERGIVPLEEHENPDDYDMDLKVTGEWTPVEHSTDFNGRRRLGLNCGTHNSCTASWCCQWCGHNCRRRRVEEVQEGGGLRRELWRGGRYRGSRSVNFGSNGQGSENANSNSVLVRTVGGGPEEGSKEEAYIQRFERRVSRALRQKLRRLAFKGKAPCLGEFWKLEVIFERHWFEELETTP